MSAPPPAKPLTTKRSGFIGFIRSEYPLLIARDGVVGVSLLLRGLRHREQTYNLQGANAYLNAIMTLSVLGLVLPSFTASVSGPNLSMVQEIFLGISALGLYGTFLLIQT